MVRKAILMVAIVALVALTAYAADPMVTWKSKRIAFTQDVKVGQQVLPAGEYKIRHEMDGTQHIMVFTQEVKGEPQFRIACKLESLNEKARVTQQFFLTENGGRVLQSVIFKGDTVRHVF